MPTVIQVRRDTAAGWTSAGTTLAAGEIGYETDTGNFKVGDGTNGWTALAYQMPYINTGSLTNGKTSTVKETLVVNHETDRVGIGTATPTEKLSVTGNAAVSGNITAGGTLAVTSDTTLTGDLAVNGGDITTTSTGTATVFNTNATTLNVGQAATTVSIGANASGTTTIRNATTAITGAATVGGTLAVTGTTAFTGAPSYAADPASANILSRKSYVDNHHLWTTLSNVDIPIGGMIMMGEAGYSYQVGSTLSNIYFGTFGTNPHNRYKPGATSGTAVPGTFKCIGLAEQSGVNLSASLWVRTA